MPRSMNRNFFASAGIVAPAGTCGIEMRPGATGGAIVGGAAWLGDGAVCAWAETDAASHEPVNRAKAARA